MRRKKLLKLRKEIVREVIESSTSVTKKARDVFLDKEALRQAAKTLSKEGFPVPPWPRWCHYFDGGLKTLTYLLVTDSINFCFWPLQGEERWRIRINGEMLSGYYALAAALKKAFEREDLPIADPSFLASLSMETFHEIMSGEGRLQLMNERLSILRETGDRLMTLFRGDASLLIEACEHSATRLVKTIAASFPSFRDEAQYDGARVCLLKRAQLLAADIHGAFEGRGWGAFSDIDALTAFADYKLPQVLRHLGIMRYSNKLSQRVDSQELIPPGSKEEVEIRASTIVAVELIKDELCSVGMKVNSSEIDWLLWNMGQDDRFRQSPYHRTSTIYY